MTLKLNYDELIQQKDIDLRYKDLVDDDLEVLWLCNVIEQSTVLDTLNLRNNNLTLADGQELNLRRNKITLKGIKHLANALKENNKLQFLYLYGNSIGDEGARCIADMLVVNKSLQDIDLSSNNISLEGAKHIAEMLADNNTLQIIDLSGNNIGDNGVKYLAEALKKNNTLIAIELSINKIGDEGVKYISDMLAVNQTLQKIDLSNSSIGDMGAESLATSLVINTGIQDIYLFNNKIGDKGAAKLADTYESKHSIKRLGLWGDSNISEDVMNRINVMNDPKSREVFMLKQSIAKKDKKLEGKDAVIAKKDRDLTKKDKQISSLKAAIRGQLQQLETIIDTVDLTSGEDTEPPKKRVRTGEDIPKSTLAIQHEQNKHFSQKLVKVKQEKNTAEASLENVRVEKQAVESNLNETRADLEDVREDLDIANETVTQVAVFTDRWQSKFDDMKALAEAAGADGAAIAAIRDR